MKNSEFLARSQETLREHEQDIATARAAARNAALEEAASIHEDRVKDLQQNLRFVRSADQESSIKHAITIHEDSASAIRALKGEG